MRSLRRLPMLAALAMLAGVGGGFVPIEPEPREDNGEPEPEPREDNGEPEPDTERPIARTAAPPTERPQTFGARAERRRQARAAQRGGR